MKKSIVYTIYDVATLFDTTSENIEKWMLEGLIPLPDIFRLEGPDTDRHLWTKKTFDEWLSSLKPTVYTNYGAGKVSYRSTEDFGRFYSPVEHFNLVEKSKKMQGKEIEY